jgi:hypothetical protein
LAADKPPPVPIVTVATSPLIVLATVSRYEMASGHTIATLENEQLLKGKAPATVRCFHDVDRRERIRVGKHVLAFLVATKDPNVGYAVAGMFMLHDGTHTGIPKVSSSAGDGGVQLPPEWCNHEEYCRVDLPVVLDKLHLPKWEPAAPHSGVFRQHSATCDHCSFEEAQRKFTPPDAIDCGKSSTSKERGRGDQGVMSCARAAIEAQKPFIADSPVTGCGAGRANWYFFDGKTLSRLVDVPASGCTGGVEIATCPAVVATNAWTFSCDNPPGKHWACDELPSDVDVLGPPEPLERLSCKLGKQLMGTCHRTEHGAWDAGAPDMLCDSAEDGGVRFCWAQY